MKQDNGKPFPAEPLTIKTVYYISKCEINYY